MSAFHGPLTELRCEKHSGIASSILHTFYRIKMWKCSLRINPQKGNEREIGERSNWSTNLLRFLSQPSPGNIILCISLPLMAASNNDVLRCDYLFTTLTCWCCEGRGSENTILFQAPTTTTSTEIINKTQRHHVWSLLIIFLSAETYKERKYLTFRLFGDPQRW